MYARKRARAPQGSRLPCGLWLEPSETSVAPLSQRTAPTGLCGGGRAFLSARPEVPVLSALLHQVEAETGLTGRQSPWGRSLLTPWSGPAQSLSKPWLAPCAASLQCPQPPPWQPTLLPPFHASSAMRARHPCLLPAGSWASLATGACHLCLFPGQGPRPSRPQAQATSASFQPPQGRNMPGSSQRMSCSSVRETQHHLEPMIGGFCDGKGLSKVMDL